MKKRIITLVMVSILSLSCQDDYLDLEPLDQYTEAVYFKTPQDFKNAANNFYGQMISWKTVNGSSIYDFSDRGSDLTCRTTDESEGKLSANIQNDKYYKNSYTYLRDNNMLISKAAAYSGNKSDIAQYVAAAKFFRAWNHFFLLKRFGGVPIVTTVIDFSSPELFGKRNSRYEVVKQILSDLTEAIPDLPNENAIASADKGQLSRQAAQAFKARVLLYEATWEKYVGNATDGDGTSIGAGSAGYNAGDQAVYLAEAVSLAREVMNSNQYSLFNFNSRLNNTSMRFLFCLEDAGSNPAGLTKADNKEFILSNKYDYALKRAGTGADISKQYVKQLSASRKFADMFLCTDGLPINKSPLFKGYGNLFNEYTDRDYRMLSYFGVYNSTSKPAAGSRVLDNNEDPSGYPCTKFVTYNRYRADTQEAYDYPQIRLAEVYLIYAEALYELNGAITDGQLEESINKLRERSGVADLTNSLVTVNGLNMLQEIRRERAIELFAENTRYDDLKRWNIATTELNQDRYGAVIQGSEFENNTSLFNPGSYAPFLPAAYPTPVGSFKTLFVSLSTKGFTISRYLQPIPTAQIAMNPKLLQNPLGL